MAPKDIPHIVPECEGLAVDYIDRFEDVMGLWIKWIRDVSHGIRERPTQDGLKIFKIGDVFSGDNEVFMGFGIPNFYLVLPDGQGGYKKFAAKSLMRAKAKFEDTRGWAQSGYLVRFKDLPPEKVELLKKLVMEEEGKRHWTCVNAHCKVLGQAGFTSGGVPLDRFRFPSHFLPYSFARRLMKHGLQLDGEDVEFEIVKTTPVPLEAFAMAVVKAVATTPIRHGGRAVRSVDHRLSLWFKKHKLEAYWAWAKGAPGKMVMALRGRERTPQEVVEMQNLVATLPGNQAYISDIDVRLARVAQLGMLLRILWGPHSLTEARVSAVNIDDFQKNNHEAFPNVRPLSGSWFKKKFLMSPFVVWLIRRQLARSFKEIGNLDERTIFNQIPVHSEASPNMHNYTVTGPNSEQGSRISITRLHVRHRYVDWVVVRPLHKIVDWLLAKHIVTSGNDDDLRCAGEMWKTADGVIHLNNNSGTYKPTAKELEQCAKYFRVAFPSIKFETHPM